LPTEGGAAIIVWNGGPTESLIAEAWLSGCAVTSLWATAEGRYVGRIQGAPAFVNALWDASFRGGIPEATPLVVFCAPGGPPAPAPTATPTSTPTPTATPTGTPGATPTGTATAPPDERDCADFETWAEAQAFFEAQG